MVRLIYCISRRNDVSSLAFRRFWEQEDYIRLLQKLAALYDVKRWERNLTLEISHNNRLVEQSGLAAPLDAIIEFWWDDTSAIESIDNTPQAKLLREQLHELENNFVDRTKCHAFFTTAEI